MKKIRHLFCLLGLLILTVDVQGQNQHDQEEAVIKTIEILFSGMRAGDSSMVRSVFHPEVRLQSVSVDKEGNPRLHNGDIQRFLAQVGSPHDQIFDEQIWSYEVKIDGRLATVWTEYTFYLGEQLSHCGVNAFHLFNGPDGWKITQITDTRRKTGCREKE